MDRNPHLPDGNRLTIVLAFCTLSQAILYIIPQTSSAPVINLFGFLLTFNWSADVLFPIVNGAIALAGANWVLSSHPDRDLNQLSWQNQWWHLVTPALAVLVMSFGLMQMQRNAFWWVVLAFSVLLFLLVTIAEYQVMSPGSPYQLAASSSLIALGHGLFLILAISLNSSTLRVYVQFPLILLAAFFVSFRTLSLRLGQNPRPAWPVCAALIVSEIALALSYTFLNALQYGLIVTGLLYAVAAAAAGLQRGLKGRALFLEPGLMLAAAGLLATIFTLF